MFRSSFSLARAISFALLLGPWAAAQSIVERESAAGVRIWDFPDDDADRFSIAVLVGVGARDEQPGQAGIAHFLEHSLFLATETRPSTSRDGDLLRRGIHHNGYTSSEATIYYLTGRASQWSFMVDWLADHLLYPKLDPEEVAAEQRIVLEEIATRGPDFAAITVEHLLYGDHPLARSIGGSARTVGSIGADDLRAFHERHYHAANIVVGFSGRVDTDECMQAVKLAFGSVSAKPTLSQDPAVEDRAPYQRTGDLWKSTDKRDTTGELDLGYHLRCEQPAELGAMLVIQRYLSRRFFDVAREQRQLTYAPLVDLDWGRDSQRLAFKCSTSQRKNVAELAGIAADLVAELQAIDSSVAASAINSALGHFGCESVDDLTDAMELAAWVSFRGSRVDDFVAQIAALTPADLASVAERTLLPKQRYSLSSQRLLDTRSGGQVALFVLLVSALVALVLYREGVRRLLFRFLTRSRRPRKGKILAMPNRPPIQAGDVDDVERSIQKFYEAEDDDRPTGDR